MSLGAPDKSPVDLILEEQQILTPVERFSRRHDSGSLPRQHSLYRELIPSSVPKAGQQFAFEVDIDKCSGCKACVTACHSLNGLEDDESWRSVGLLVGKPAPADGVPITFRNPASDIRHPASAERMPDTRSRMPTPVQRTVTTACHHCADPGCLNGCPVLAYEKDAVTGIVRHLDDQCIGCQYCVMKCPYEVPKYSKRLGIVRKCDMCTQRLAVGEAPACVQACPNEAIRIRIVDVAEALSKFRPPESPARNGHNNGTSGIDGRIPSNPFLAGSPDPSITIPTTRYLTTLDGVELAPADNASLKPADPHLPLALMLPLSQLSAGLLFGVSMSMWLARTQVETLKAGVTASFLAMAVALGVATLHLGQPLRAWKAFLGWRKSWFSREVIAFGAYVKVLAGLTGVLWLKPELLSSGIWHPASGITSLLGFIAVYCSVMLYADTQREFWSFPRTSFRFLGSTFLLGAASTAVLLDSSKALWIAVLVTTAFKLAGELELFRWRAQSGFHPLKKSALLMTGALAKILRLRLGLGVVGGLLLPALLVADWLPRSVGWGVTTVSLILLGEICERVLFFTAVAPTKMPGGVAP